jgi:predicted NBD/HSP70 family sugar kinase
VLLNDADAAIVAEVWGSDSKDAYRSAKNIAMITIGTGVRLNILTHLLYITLTVVLSLESYG